MLVVDRAKALAMRLKNPNRVLSVLPSAKQIEHKGVNFVVAPHRLDTAKILNNIGIKAPSPIMHYYDWPGLFTPFDHQKETAAFLTMQPKGLVLNEIGTGKTQSALWAADYMMREGAVKKVLIMSPLSTLQRVWADAIFKGFPDRDFVVLHGTSQRRLKLLDTDVDYYIINHDGFPIISEKSVGKFDLVIVDEAAVFRNPSTRRFKIFRKWMERNPQTMLWMMTGTPTPNDPTDAWALAKLVDSPHLNKTYTGYREQVMMKVGQWKWVPRPDSIDIVHNVLQPAVRYNREDCFDLPETVVQTRQVDLTKEQRKHYNSMMRTLVTEFEETDITAVNEAVKMQKLVQIACGVAYGSDGQNIEIDASPRVNLVKEIIKEAGEKVIVFVPLTGTLKMLEREVAKDSTVAVVNGDVPSGKRNQIFHDFQENQDPQVLIAHPGTMSHGLTLTSASTIIWYGPIHSNEQYVQANGRIERIGKTNVSNVIHIEGTELERKMYTRLENKQNLQGLLLDLVQEQTKETANER